jgi:hypothetical protein
VQANTTIVEKAPALVKDGQFQAQDEKAIYEIIKYNAFSDKKVDELIKDKTDEEKKEIKGAIKKEKDSSGQKALADMTIFPVIMLVFYIGLIFHFSAKGGYKPLVLGADGETSEAGDDDTSDEGEEEKEPEKDD